MRIHTENYCTTHTYCTTLTVPRARHAARHAARAEPEQPAPSRVRRAVRAEQPSATCASRQWRSGRRWPGRRRSGRRRSGRRLHERRQGRRRCRIGGWPGHAPGRAEPPGRPMYQHLDAAAARQQARCQHASDQPARRCPASSGRNGRDVHRPPIAAIAPRHAPPS